jgi:hypothetical protein
MSSSFNEWMIPMRTSTSAPSASRVIVGDEPAVAVHNAPVLAPRGPGPGTRRIRRLARRGCAVPANMSLPAPGAQTQRRRTGCTLKDTRGLGAVHEAASLQGRGGDGAR